MYTYMEVWLKTLHLAPRMHVCFEFLTASQARDEWHAILHIRLSIAFKLSEYECWPDMCFLNKDVRYLDPGSGRTFTNE